MSSFIRTSINLLMLTGSAVALPGAAWAATLGCNSLCHWHGAPAPVAGAGLPIVLIAGAALLIANRVRRRAQ